MNMEIVVKNIAPIRVLFRRDRLTIPRVPAHAAPAIDSLMAALRRADVPPAVPVIFVYYGIEADPTQEFDLDICVPLPADAAISVSAPIGCKTLPAFDCISAPQVSAGYLFAGCLGCTLLGIYVTFSPVSVCPLYSGGAPALRNLIQHEWGITHRLDQQIGGLLMWVPACAVYLGAIIATLASWYRATSRDRMRQL
jgi:hypothetical protein